jgi:flagellar protein FlbD
MFCEAVYSAARGTPEFHDLFIGGFAFRFSHSSDLAQASVIRGNVTRLTLLNRSAALPILLIGKSSSPMEEVRNGSRMIQLTRLNNKPLMVNSDLIKFVEQAPDTLVTLISGEKILVLEKPDEVLARIVAFRRSVLERVSLPWNASSAHALTPVLPAPESHEPER